MIKNIFLLISFEFYLHSVDYFHNFTDTLHICQIFIYVGGVLICVFVYLFHIILFIFILSILSFHNYDDHNSNKEAEGIGFASQFSQGCSYPCYS